MKDILELIGLNPDSDYTQNILEETEYKDYFNPKFGGFTMQYPKGWWMRDLSLSNVKSIATQFRSQIDDSVSIRIDLEPSKQSLNEYVSSIIEDYQIGHKNYGGIDNIHTKRLIFKNYQGEGLSFELTEAEKELKQLIIFIEIDEYTFIYKFKSPTNEIIRYLKIVKYMVESIKLNRS